MSEREQLEILLSAYLDGELDAARKTEVDALLQRDADARALLADLRVASQSLAALPRAQASDELMEHIRERMERAALLGEDQSVVAARSPRRSLLRWVSAAAVIGLTLLGGYLLLPGGEDAPANLQLAQRDALPGEQDTPEDGTRAAGRLSKEQALSAGGGAGIADSAEGRDDLRHADELHVVNGVSGKLDGVAGDDSARDLGGFARRDRSVEHPASATPAIPAPMEIAAKPSDAEIETVRTVAPESKAALKPAMGPDAAGEVVLELTFADEDQLQQAVSALRAQALPQMAIVGGASANVPSAGGAIAQSRTPLNVQVNGSAEVEGRVGDDSPRDGGSGIAPNRMVELGSEMARGRATGTATDAVIYGDVSVMSGSPASVTELTITLPDQASLERAARVLSQVHRQAAAESWQASPAAGSEALAYLQKEISAARNEELGDTMVTGGWRANQASPQNASVRDEDGDGAASARFGGVGAPVAGPPLVTPARDALPEPASPAAARAPLEERAAPAPGLEQVPAEGFAAKQSAGAGTAGESNDAAMAQPPGANEEDLGHPLHPAQMPVPPEGAAPPASQGGRQQVAERGRYHALLDRIGRLLHPFQSAAPGAAESAEAPAPMTDETLPRLRLRLQVPEQVLRSESRSD